jgi:alpha-D-xyloside xylohydrolase
MLGPALLVVPVTEPGGQVRFYLPAGKWFDIWEEAWVEGPQTLEVQVPLDRIPLFGRKGHILPLGPAVQHTGELNPGVHLAEVWCFGKPQQGLTLPGIDLSLSSSGELLGVPDGIPVIDK